MLKPIIYYTIFFLFTGCKINVSPISTEQENKIIYPPSKDLSVSEILKIQNINSLHFIQYDSVSINNRPGGEYSISQEIFLDSKHIRTVQYLPGERPWIVTVIDLEEWNVWQYSLTFNDYIAISFPDTLRAFEVISKKHITSRLYPGLKSIRYEYLDEYYCHLVSDSLKNIEWIWLKHGLPVKWETTFYQDGIKVNAHGKLVNIEINQEFPDSIFIKP